MIRRISPALILFHAQAPGESLKLKTLKALIDEHSSSVFSDFSSKRDALAYLRQKVWSMFLFELRNIMASFDG